MRTCDPRDETLRQERLAVARICRCGTCQCCRELAIEQGRVQPIRDPNNVRNRYRRKAAAFIAYGWGTGEFSSFPSLRQFAQHYPADAYSAGPVDRRETFAELLARSKRS